LTSEVLLLSEFTLFEGKLDEEYIEGRKLGSLVGITVSLVGVVDG
jgi:hypothetical protein